MNYTIRQIASPIDRSSKLYYCVGTSSGVTGIREIARRISQSCTLTTVDIVAVLEGFLQYLPQYLIEGYSVKLSDFGILKLSLKSQGHLKAADCSTDDIMQVRVRFLPGTLLKNTLKSDITYTYRKDADSASSAENQS